VLSFLIEQGLKLAQLGGKTTELATPSGSWLTWVHLENDCQTVVHVLMHACVSVQIAPFYVHHLFILVSVLFFCILFFG